MDDEQPHQELVKCVLVGDNAVGKTRLICARACRQKVSLGQLLNTHVPTVWAIDQYRIYKEVLENSMMTLDGVNVSLRLWDTFGDHHKDRRFAYGRSDVVLMCFDIGRQGSLENCRDMWFQQVRKFCPNTPVILVGCKNDVRFMLNDEQYLNYCRERSPLVRQVREKDLVLPERGRAVAKDLGIPYYETSVLTYFGVDEVFENAIRAALCARRQQRFWMTNLKRVPMPILQVPFCPPRPPLPTASTLPSTFSESRLELFQQQNFTDVILISDRIGFSAHRFVLAATSSLLERILSPEYAAETAAAEHAAATPRSNSETSLVSCSFGSSDLLCSSNLCCDDTECLLPNKNSLRPPDPNGGIGTDPSKLKLSPIVARFGHRCRSEQNSPAKGGIRTLWQRHRRINNQNSNVIKERALGRRRRSNSFHLSSTSSMSTLLDEKSMLPQLPTQGVSCTINHPAIQALRVQQCESLGPDGSVTSTLQTILTCNSRVLSAKALAQVVQFVYTGDVDATLCASKDIKHAAEFLAIPDLYSYMEKLERVVDEDIRKSLRRENDENFGIALESMFLSSTDRCQFADVLFRLDDGVLAAHRAILMARCDMMNAMFAHKDFVEASARVVKFPGVSCFAFRELLLYLYTDRAPSPRLSPSNCLSVIELANRLCLPRLISLVEVAVVAKMEKASGTRDDSLEAVAEVMEDALKIIESCQVHNALQLGDWCLHYLAQNYNQICRKFPKVLRTFHPENQAWLNVHRWPPIWYLKDFDFYQRMLMERERSLMEGPKKNRKRRARTNSTSSTSSGAASGCLCFSASAGNKSLRGAYAKY